MPKKQDARTKNFVERIIAYIKLLPLPTVLSSLQPPITKFGYKVAKHSSLIKRYNNSHSMPHMSDLSNIVFPLQENFLEKIF